MPFMFNFKIFADVDSKRKTFLVIRFDCARFPWQEQRIVRGYLSRNTRACAHASWGFTSQLQNQHGWTQE